MAQTPVGAIKVASAAVGLTAEEYEARVAAGLKWCSGCKRWQPRTDFTRDASRSDGLNASCAEYRNADGRARYVPSPRPARGRALVPARDGDALQARRRVNYFVEAGILARPDALPCADCGHVCTPGDPIRHEYDHHLGYAAEHHEHVEALCAPCHHRRERRRRGD